MKQYNIKTIYNNTKILYKAYGGTTRERRKYGIGNCCGR